MVGLFGLQNSFFDEIQCRLSVIRLYHFLLEALEQLFQDEEIVWFVINNQHLILHWAAGRRRTRQVPTHPLLLIVDIQLHVRRMLETHHAIRPAYMPFLLNGLQVVRVAHLV
jgi:hypothetical protein